jgi:hypothetical protein
MAGLTEDDLTRGWSLAPDDAAEVLRARGTQHRLRCAVQLCTLRATGRFVADYRHVPIEAVNHLAAQLGLDPLLFLPDPERPATESAQLHRIRQHLGWHEFDAAAERGLRTRLQERAAEGMTGRCWRTPRICCARRGLYWRPPAPWSDCGAGTIDFFTGFAPLG